MGHGRNAESIFGNQTIVDDMGQSYIFFHDGADQQPAIPAVQAYVDIVKPGTTDGFRVSLHSSRRRWVRPVIQDGT